MNIEIYTKDGCPWCDKAKEWLDNHGLDYDVIDLTHDETRMAFYEEYQVNSVPQIFINGKRIGGYTELSRYGEEEVVKTQTCLDPSRFYKPFLYPEFVEIARTHEKMHWVEDEIDLSEDVSDWKGNRLTQKEKDFIKKVLTLFTESDVAVAGNYVDQFLPRFKNNEIRQMLLGFAARECFDDKTEVLTNNGWKLFRDVRENETVAQWDMETKQISFSNPIDRIVKPYKGKLHVYDSRCTSIATTPGHDLVLINPHTKKVTKQKSEAGMWGRNFLYPDAGYSECEVEVEESVLVLDKILCAIAADGTIDALSPWNLSNRPNSRKTTIGVHKERKAKRLEYLIKRYEHLTGYNEYSFGLKHSDGGFKYRFNVPDHIPLDQIKSYEWMGQDLSKIPLSRIQTIVEETRYWDGTENVGNGIGFQFYTSHEVAKERISAFAVLSGYRSGLSISRTSEELMEQVLPQGNLPIACKTSYKIGIKKQTETVYPHRKEVDYDGMVYCFTMPRGTLVCRRNGKTFISGNCTHQRAYALLNETLGFPDSFYSEFLQYREMADKIEHMRDSDVSTHRGLALALAKSVFNEGVMLFASFAMLLNFARHNKMKGMCKVVDWSIKDEHVHATSLAKLFRVLCSEKTRFVNDEFKREIYSMARETVALEDSFVNLAFEHNADAIQGMTADEVKGYIRYITDQRLVSLGLKENYGVENPLDWIDWVIGGERHGNFFESRVSGYAVGGLTGCYNYDFLKNTDH